MFRKHGLLGIALIIFAQIMVLLRIEPIATFYIPIIWSGYILLVDSIVYLLKGGSLLADQKLKFLQMFLISISFWFLFEIYNQVMPGWNYRNLPSRTTAFVMGSLSFATIVPAVLETFELIQQLHLFGQIKLDTRFLKNKYVINIFFVTGIVFLVSPFIIISPFVWMLVWSGFVLLIDPILYLMHDEKSLIMLAKKKKFNTFFSLILAGTVCGVLWEFWNSTARTGWYYTWQQSLPFIFQIKLFEMPILGYIGYWPFALELYVMYRFVRLIFSKKGLGGVAGI